MQKFGRDLQAILREGLELWNQRQRNELTDVAYQASGSDLHQRLSEHLRPRKMRDEDNQRLLDGIGYRHDNGQVFLFLERPEIEPTNNRAERGLRGAVIARKVSQCSKNERGSDMYAKLKSLTATMRLREENVLSGLAKLLRPTPC